MPPRWLTASDLSGTPTAGLVGSGARLQRHLDHETQVGDCVRLVHFMRNVLSLVAKSAQAMVAATVRTIFEQPDRAAAAAQLRQVCSTLEARFPAVVRLIEDAEAEILTFYDFPAAHRRQIASTNPLERLNKELKRRSHVVGIFPNRAAVLRLFGAVLAEQNDEWLVGRHYFSEASMRQLVRATDTEPALPEEVAAA